MGTRTTDPYHDAWETYLQIEHMQRAERASGKMRRTIGRVLPGESREELEQVAAEDERMARRSREAEEQRWEDLLQARRRAGASGPP
jgi:hypothetical protein